VVFCEQLTSVEFELKNSGIESKSRVLSKANSLMFKPKSFQCAYNLHNFLRGRPKRNRGCLMSDIHTNTEF
jgi:hypothetical protein